MAEVHWWCFDCLEGQQWKTEDIHRKSELDLQQYQTHIQFLDLRIAVENNTLVRKTYRKETAANTLLKADSFHPVHLKYGIPTGQFLWIRRNCTKISDYQEEAKLMYQRFWECGYSHMQIRSARKKAAMWDRMSLLKEREPAPSQINQSGWSHNMEHNGGRSEKYSKNIGGSWPDAHHYLKSWVLYLKWWCVEHEI